jgi:hypothetical protein
VLLLIFCQPLKLGRMLVLLAAAGRLSLASICTSRMGEMTLWDQNDLVCPIGQDVRRGSSGVQAGTGGLS